jgi:type VI secretion system protein ImpA
VIIADDDYAAMLLPIAVGEGGAGIDGRVDDAAVGEMFREIRFQRKAIFRQEQRAAMGEDVSDSETWSWSTLAEVARDYLTGSAKDLEAVAILIEAVTRLDGLSGVDRSMNLLADIVEAFWDNGLYPPADEEDGVDARFQPLSGLSGGSGDKDGTLILPLRKLVLAGDGQGELCYLDRLGADAKFAASQTGTPAQRGARAQDAQNAFDEADAIARRLSRRTLQAAADRLQSAETAWRRAVALISERSKPRFPSTSRLSDELRNMREWLEGLLRKLPEDPVDAGSEAVGNDPAAAGAPALAAGGPMIFGRIGQRDDALRAVSAAADFFERNEPSSPLGAALREVDRRARLSLQALLQELIPDAAVRQTYYWRSGIKPPAEDAGA